MSDEVLCIGEILWDALPDGLFLGGAPFNVACHLQSLRGHTAFVSRVGDDQLGREALRRMRARGLETGLMQIDHSLPTGFVQVELGGTGEPDYEILEPAAWDAITFTDALQQHVDRAVAIVYGSLAQRALTSQQTIRRLCEVERALRVFDINLRPPFIDRDVVEHSIEAADVVKCNDDEFRFLRDWFDLSDRWDPAMTDLATAFDCAAVCITSGGNGARLWMDGTTWYHPGYSVDVRDTVGAGDAFLAALLTNLLDERDGETVLRLANQLGAYVASRAGAFPSYPFDDLDEIEQLDLAENEEPR